MPISSGSEAEQIRVETLAAMKRLNDQMPGEPAFESIITQLQHLGLFLKAGIRPIARASELNFGFLGMKFVREFDEPLSSKLASLAQYIEDEHR